MEQRIGPTSPPVHAAGTDPAAIPGLTTPSSAAEPEDTAPEPQAADETAAVAAPEEPDVATETATETAGESADDKAAEAEAADGETVNGETADGDAENESAEGGEPEPDGPAFRVSDRRASIAADHTGITFRLDTEEAEFSWDEVRAVAIDTPRFGRRFAVTVYTGPRRWFEHDVEAQSKSLLKEWTTQLDAVLDRYFEDGDNKDDEADAAEAADADAPEKSEA